MLRMLTVGRADLFAAVAGPAPSLARRPVPVAHGLRIMNDFTVKPLNFNQIDQAYALLRMAWPGLAQDDWRALAASRLAAPPRGEPATQGVMTAQNDHGYIVGLFVYLACDHLRHGRILRIDHAAALDLFDHAGVWDVLLRSVAELAQLMKCAEIEAVWPAGDAGPSESQCAALGAPGRPTGQTAPPYSQSRRLYFAKICASSPDLRSPAVSAASSSA